MRISPAGRYLETIRHLRWSQIFGRLWFRAYRPKADLRAPEPLRSLVSPWQPASAKRPSMEGPNSAIFLNEPGDISAPGIWQDQSRPLLWLYNLHYFDDLSAAGAPDRRDWHTSLIDRWISENAPVSGVGWQPYPSSLRIVNWIKWHLASGPLGSQALASLAIQARHLTQRLEYHILGNHLLANAKALYYAGSLFDGVEAEKWLALGRRLLEREIAEQVLADGAHFELSPMYHLIVLDDLLDVINIGHAYGLQLPAGIELAARKMLAWSAVMRHPDGEIPFFNDATIGIAPSPPDLDEYAARLGIAAATAPSPHVMLRSSGYVRMARGNAVLFADAAMVGPTYLPGHAHADTLSFELSIGNERLLVNCGTSVYGTGPERQRQRSTSAHNTLSIDGQNSSDVWAGFRVGRRASVTTSNAQVTQDDVSLVASHDGYRHLPGRPIHERRWSLTDRVLTVTDTVIGSGSHLLESAFQLHPEVTATATPDGFSLLLPSGGEVVMRVSADCEPELVSSTWHPGMGIAVPSKSISLKRRVALPAALDVSFHWAE